MSIRARRPSHPLVVSALVVALLVAPRAAGAQEQIDSTTELKRACEAAVNHFVYVTTDVEINRGPHEDVTSGCQIALGPAASFEAGQVSMRFTGPFRLDSSRERSVSFTRSVWKAPSLEVHGGEVSSFKNVAALLQATAGHIEISGGEGSSVQLQSRPSGSAHGLKATRSVSITGSSKLVSLGDTGVEGGAGVSIQLGGEGSTLNAHYAELRSPGGAVRIVSGAPKALVELNRVTLAGGRGDTAVRLAATDSRLKTEFTSISSQGGGVDLLAGGQGWVGGVELVESRVAATRGVSVQGSPGEWNRFGTVKAAKSTFSGGADVVFRTGRFGTTEVKESSVRSGTAIRVLTGVGGSCTAEKNALQAPVRQICP